MLRCDSRPGSNPLDISFQSCPAFSMKSSFPLSRHRSTSTPQTRSCLSRHSTPHPSPPFDGPPALLFEDSICSLFGGRPLKAVISFHFFPGRHENQLIRFTSRRGYCIIFRVSFTHQPPSPPQWLSSAIDISPLETRVKNRVLRENR